MVGKQVGAIAALAISAACSQTGTGAESTALETEAAPVTEPSRPTAAIDAADPDGSAAIQLPGTQTVDLVGKWAFSDAAGVEMVFEASRKGTTSGPVVINGAWSDTGAEPAFWIYTTTGTLSLIDAAGAPVWTGKPSLEEPETVIGDNGDRDLIRQSD